MKDKWDHQSAFEVRSTSKDRDGNTVVAHFFSKFDDQNSLTVEGMPYGAGLRLTMQVDGKRSHVEVLKKEEQPVTDTTALKDKLIEAADELYSACREFAAHSVRTKRIRDAEKEYAAASDAYRSTQRPQLGETWMHLGSGRSYRILHVATMQYADDKFTSLDMREVIVYRKLDEDRVWTRLLTEFMDGRFKRIT